MSAISVLGKSSLLMLAIVLWLPADALAQRAQRGGGHAAAAHPRPQARASAHTSVNRPATRPQAASRGAAGNRNAAANRNVNRNVNRNQDINVNRNVNVDVDYHHDHWDDWDDHPFATAAAVTAGVAVTSAVIGSIVNSVPPSCVTTVINGIAYQQCGSTWYQPQYYGTSVQYVVVVPP